MTQEPDPLELAVKAALATIATALKIWMPSKSDAQIQAWGTWFQTAIYGLGGVEPLPNGHLDASPFGGAPVAAAVSLLGEQMAEFAPSHTLEENSYVMSTMLNNILMQAGAPYLSATATGRFGGVDDDAPDRLREALREHLATKH